MPVAIGKRFEGLGEDKKVKRLRSLFLFGLLLPNVGPDT